MNEKCLLVVDDETKELDWLLEFCGTQGVAYIQTANTIGDALEKLNAGKVTAMITDLVIGLHNAGGISLIACAQDYRIFSGEVMALHSRSIDRMLNFEKANLLRRTPGLSLIQKRDRFQLKAFISGLG